MTIAAVLRDKGSAIETIQGNATVHDAVRRLGEKRIGALPVVEEGRIAGIMSERDVIYCLRDHGPDVLEGPVSRVMSSPAITAESGSQPSWALNSPLKWPPWPIRSAGSWYSCDVQVPPMLTGTPPLVHDHPLACGRPSAWPSSCEMTWPPNEV